MFFKDYLPLTGKKKDYLDKSDIDTRKSDIGSRKSIKYADDSVLDLSGEKLGTSQGFKTKFKLDKFISKIENDGISLQDKSDSNLKPHPKKDIGRRVKSSFYKMEEINSHDHSVIT